MERSERFGEQFKRFGEIAHEISYVFVVSDSSKNMIDRFSRYLNASYLAHIAIARLTGNHNVAHIAIFGMPAMFQLFGYLFTLWSVTCIIAVTRTISRVQVNRLAKVVYFQAIDY